ncbi:hypothetical protein, partial [Peribacillus sp. NPDC056705]|uniref:hypothetical protein n=1 Tax=Peribacillus sp. NPDC056705 TaxID=3345918 RepID=UPI00374792DC
VLARSPEGDKDAADKKVSIIIRLVIFFILITYPPCVVYRIANLELEVHMPPFLIRPYHIV